ncbi:MAG: hypothetical protein RMJ98_00090 [Myxococcales bacterium]|nr:hypothetical protein [Polyangiaceae bacterium]MDW8247685.1 hypothetical protein [Myxococcales bacterium]
MADHENRNRLKELVKEVREQAKTDVRLQLDRQGMAILEQVVADLTGPEGMPGLYVHREGAQKVRLRRQGKAGQIVVEWDRGIGALEVTYEKFNARPRKVRYLLNEVEGAWRSIETQVELYEELTEGLKEILYPEARR